MRHAALSRSTRILIPLALAGYGASLFTRPFACASGPGSRGYEVLLTGWFGLAVLDPRWYANLTALWLVCCLWNGWRGRHTAVAAVLTLVLAAASVLPALGCAGDPGSAALSLGLQGGGYLWIAALSLVAGCALREFARAR